MRGFSELIDKLLLTSSRNRKIDILCDYFKSTPDPDRGFALAIITNCLELKNIPISKIKEIVKENVDAELFALSFTILLLVYLVNNRRFSRMKV